MCIVGRLALKLNSAVKDIRTEINSVMGIQLLFNLMIKNDTCTDLNTISGDLIKLYLLVRAKASMFSLTHCYVHEWSVTFHAYATDESNSTL